MNHILVVKTIKFGLGLSNYVKKSDLKNRQVLIHQILLKRMTYLAENEELDIGRLETTPVDLSKLSDAVKN